MHLRDTAPPSPSLPASHTALLAALGANTALTELSLAACELGGVEAATALAASLCTNATLRKLTFARFHFGEPAGFDRVLSAIGSSTSALTALDITGHWFSLAACEALGGALAGGSRLEELTTAFCRIGAEGAAAIAARLAHAAAAEPSAPAKTCALRHWDLYGNELGPEGAAALVAALAGSYGRAAEEGRVGGSAAATPEPSRTLLAARRFFPNLLSLKIADNCIGDAGVAAMAHAGLGSISSLTELDVGGNKLTDAGILALARHWAAGRFGVVASGGGLLEEASLPPPAAAWWHHLDSAAASAQTVERQQQQQHQRLANRLSITAFQGKIHSFSHQIGDEYFDIPPQLGGDDVPERRRISEGARKAVRRLVKRVNAAAAWVAAAANAAGGGGKGGKKFRGRLEEEEEASFQMEV